ncbi:MAG: TonB system transport protein ExbD [Gammaproteobacteria bacterium]|nr:TonB system transport protein ExbD [Gammaproteobacteria bacterium]
MRPISTMNVIPFIDVMLVLLAVVLTTATFVAQGKIPVALPDAASADQLPVTQPIEITVSDDGAVFFADEAVDDDALAQRIAQLDTHTTLLLRVDAGAAFRHFVRVIDLLKARGLNDVSIVTRQSGGG